jgi:hypothetical protein
MIFHKTAAPQNHSIGKVTYLAAQLFLNREFSLFLLHHLLGLGQIKGRGVYFCSLGRPF